MNFQPSTCGAKTSFRLSPHGWAAAGILLHTWFTVIRHLRVEWTLNEQYSYGWAIPFLCAFLFWKRWQSAPTLESSTLLPAPPSVRLLISAALFLLALAFIVTRLIEEANPDWRLVSWMLAGEAVSLSLLLLYAWRGFSALRQFAVPVVFFLVAVPWPTFLEHSVIQTLTRANVSITVEFLNWFGFPALRHGNVIETAGGLVDIDTACSGVRSLQASFMMALFFGELKRLSVQRRLALCGVTIALAMFFNATRTIFLSVVTANSGSAATARWHDPAGIIVLLACFTAVWAAAAWMGRGAAQREANVASNQARVVASSRLGVHPRFSLALVVLVVMGEIAVQTWYRSAAPVSSLDWN
ncbi:MAG TPA: exosortase/archaeosortase family protein, partial [Candidatus Limnocylindria bacterium]|nr:exosortase/archaeosortase family protein [Candidatus Limnocylindria bacterium]